MATMCRTLTTQDAGMLIPSCLINGLDKKYYSSNPTNEVQNRELIWSNLNILNGHGRSPNFSSSKENQGDGF